MACSANLAHHLFLYNPAKNFHIFEKKIFCDMCYKIQTSVSIKFCWDKAVLADVYLVSGCFCTMTAELASCDSSWPRDTQTLHVCVTLSGLSGLQISVTVNNLIAFLMAYVLRSCDILLFMSLIAHMQTSPSLLCSSSAVRAILLTS